MARLKDRGANVGLRDYLLAEATDVRDTLSCPLIKDPDNRRGEPIRGEVMPWLYDVLSGRVDDLGAGREVLIHRYDLPDDHPERDAGLPGDYLVLDADDVLRPQDG